MSIFVSYTTRDYYINRELLEGVCEALSEYGHHYIDLLHNDSIDKQRHVEKMLYKAKLLILLSSSSVEKSEWVRWELIQAERSFIPIVVVKATPNKNETLRNLKSKLTAEYENLTNQSSHTQLHYAGI